VRERISVRAASQTTWYNPLEEAFYGGGEGRATARHPAVTLIHLADAYLAGSEPFLYSGPHTLLRLDPSLDEIPQHKVRRPIAWRATRLDGPVLSLGSRTTENHAHFVFEHLPLVLLARERLGPELPLRILVSLGQSSWQAEYLARIGEDPQRVIEACRGTLHCPDLWFVPNLPFAERADLYEPALYGEIGRRLMRGAQASRHDRCLFLTRKDAPRRRLVNEDELFEEVRRTYPGVERVSMAGRSLQEQIELFAEARFVIGAIGQAFTNLLFCRNALCIQLVPGQRRLGNTYCVWAYNYERLGFIHGNRCLSLYAGEPYGDGDWAFPASALRAALDRLRGMDASIR
jgi:hypothetical protein